MSAAKHLRIRQLREVTRERNHLLAAVKRLTAELRRLDDADIQSATGASISVDETEMEAVRRDREVGREARPSPQGRSAEVRSIEMTGPPGPA
jgi:hypothetical protein